MFGIHRKSPEMETAGAMLNLVREQWSDVEEAKQVTAIVLLLADTEFYAVAPEFKENPVRQRTIAVAMFASVSKSGVRHLGKTGALKLFQATSDYAGKRGEVSFFLEMRKALQIEFTGRQS